MKLYRSRSFWPEALLGFHCSNYCPPTLVMIHLWYEWHTTVIQLAVEIQMTAACGIKRENKKAVDIQSILSLPHFLI